MIMTVQTVLIGSFGHVCQFFLIFNHFVFIEEKFYPNIASYSEKKTNYFFTFLLKRAVDNSCQPFKVF